MGYRYNMEYFSSKTWGMRPFPIYEQATAFADSLSDYCSYIIFDGKIQRVLAYRNTGDLLDNHQFFGLIRDIESAKKRFV